MGNRFKDMAGYHSIIIAHGVIATIVFLGIVPTSIFIIRYYSRWNPFGIYRVTVAKHGGYAEPNHIYLSSYWSLR